MSEGGGDSFISSQGSWSEDFSSNGKNDFETSYFYEGHKDPDNSEDANLTLALLFHLLMKPSDQWENFVTKRFLL